MFLCIDPGQTDSVRLVFFTEHGVQQEVVLQARNKDFLRMIAQALESFGKTRDDIRGIAVVLGTGGFTSTRIAVTIANTWGYASSIPVLGILPEEADEYAVLAARLAAQPVGVYITAAYSGEPNIGRIIFMLSAYTKYRMLEVLPGLSIWITLIGGVYLSFVHPLLMIYFIIIFDVYWTLRVLNFSFYLLVAWHRLRAAKKINWKEKLQREIPHHTDKRHLVFLALYDEPWDVVKGALQSICAAAYDPKQMVVVIAGEEKKKENFDRIVQQAKERFDTCFLEIVGILHPQNLPGEIPGKGSNLHYAEQQMKTYVDKEGWNYDHLIVTVFDIDTVCHEQYFAYLTYMYCTHPRPTRSSYQPIALYNNNMWESPAPLRLMAFGTTFWIMTSLARQDGLVTFSSHSMSFRALVDAGFHEKRIVSEDSRIFYQCLLAYDGDYEVTPLYIPVSMDTVRDERWWQSIKNLYKQQRRWAWGVEHVPFLLWEFTKKGNKVPLWKKAKWVFLEWGGKWSWCTVAFLITILGRLPTYVASDTVRASALFINAPFMLRNLMTIAMIGMLLSALLSLPLLPARPKSHPAHKYGIMFLQWLLLPFSLLLLSAIPAIDAVTHLMFGRYLGFNVSQKKRGIRASLDSPDTQ